MATAGAVASEAVRQAIQQQATTLLLVHVLDEHTVLNGLLGMTGSYSEPIRESSSECECMLRVAEQVIRAEFAAIGKPAPKIEYVMTQGHVGEALGEVAARHGAERIVVGARRPHLFGRLTHPDVKAHLATHAPCRVHVAPLQEPTPAQPS
jgi:nucleotide-binding universal stress UspA family protein